MGFSFSILGGKETRLSEWKVKLKAAKSQWDLHKDALVGLNKKNVAPTRGSKEEANWVKQTWAGPSSLSKVIGVSSKGRR